MQKIFVSKNFKRRQISSPWHQNRQTNSTIDASGKTGNQSGHTQMSLEKWIIQLKVHVYFRHIIYMSLRLSKSKK